MSMSGWHNGPLAGFDLETTSADPETARIVTAAIVTRGTGADLDAAWLADPGVEIPPEASAIHGVTTEKARELGLPAAQAVSEIASTLTAVMAQGVPVVVFNAPYDLTVLDRETRRHGIIPFSETGLGTVIDPLVLDKHLDRYRRGSRTLGAACQHYGVTLESAHDSGGDALAAMRLAWKLAIRFPQIAAMNLPDLHALQVTAKAAQAASFQDYLRRQGSAEIVDASWPARPYAEAVL